MALPDIDFRNVRPHEGSRDAGFEELCAQLASLDPHPPKSEFVRKGRGGDAGVECLIRLKNGDERGWQAKYLFSWDASLASQLDESINTALAKHPRLTEYIVCIPFDLSDSRVANRQTARQRWDEWKRNWESKAAADSRKLSISLWDKSALSRRLSTDAAAYAGRLFYWFGDKALTQAWFEQEFRKARDTLGSRYTPETNIELPVRGIPRQTMRYSTANANSVRPHVRTAKPVAATVARCAIDMKALQPQEHMRTHSAALRSWRSWKIGEFEFLAKVRIGGGGRWALVGDYPAMKPAQKGTTFFPV